MGQIDTQLGFYPSQVLIHRPGNRRFFRLPSLVSLGVPPNLESWLEVNTRFCAICVIIFTITNTILQERIQFLVSLCHRLPRATCCNIRSIHIKRFQNFITSLEKRVRSRLPMARIVFQPASTLTDYVKAFGSFLGAENSECSLGWCRQSFDELARLFKIISIQLVFTLSLSFQLGLSSSEISWQILQCWLN